MTNRVRRCVLLLGLLGAFSSVAAAQHAPLADRFALDHVSLSKAQPESTGRMVFGGLAVGAAGFFAGGFIGAIIADRSSDLEFAALSGFAVGAVIGETVGLPLGVHVGNRARGDFAPSLLASAAIAAAGLALASHGEDHLEYLIPVPILQLVASIAIERRTTR